MDGLRFADAEYLNLFFLLPVYWLIVRYLWKTRRQQLEKKFGAKNYEFLVGSLDPGRRRWKLRLEILILSFFILALARPQVEGGVQKVKNEGVEVLLLVDVSRSMLAEDLRPNRLEVAKRELGRLVDLSSGDRFGVIAFAGSAVLLSPMTTDKSAIKMYLDSLNPDTVSTQGTDIGKALDIAHQALKRGGLGDVEEAAVTRAVLVASDGEDHQKSTEEVIKKMLDEDIRVFTLAFGTEKGAPIPVKDSTGNTRGYVTDQAGQTVLSSLQPDSLKNLAKLGKGSFHHFSFTTDSISSIRSDLEKLQKAQFSDGEIITYDEKFQLFLLIGLLVGLFYLMLGDRKVMSRRVWRGRFEAEAS